LDGLLGLQDKLLRKVPKLVPIRLDPIKTHQGLPAGMIVAGAKPRISVVNMMLMVAFFAVSAMPVCAQGHQPDTAKLKAEAQKAFNIITGDKLKIQLFCEMAELGNQLDQAERQHDTKKADEVSQKMDALEEKLPEYSALVAGLKEVDPNSQDAQEIGSIILNLDDFCD
jgi:hypothetical protein